MRPAKSRIGGAGSEAAGSVAPEFASDDQFVSYAAFQSITRRFTREEFLQFIDSERERSDKGRDDQRHRREHEEIKNQLRRIREPQVRRQVEVVFACDFDVPCGFRCGSSISADQFYVVREFDKFALCCKTCATTKETAGCGTDERIMTRYRADAWILYHGRNVRGHCYHCGPESRKMHVLLTAWHAGHDIPDSKNGSREATNMAPLHAGCNRDQGVETFKEYQEDY